MSALPLCPKPLRCRKIPFTADYICHCLALFSFKCPLLLPTLRLLSSMPCVAAEPESSSISSATRCPAIIDPAYLSCSLPEKKPLKVAVLLSGDVGSSVALRLLHAAGHSCTAFYLKIWFQVSLGPSFYSCDLSTEINGNGHEIAVVKLSGDDQVLGRQFAAFYQGLTCVGSPFILRSQRRNMVNPFPDLFHLGQRHLHSLSVLPQRRKPRRDSNMTLSDWNTNHKFVLSNPTLLLLETKCRSMIHLKQVQSQMIVSGLYLDGLAYSRLIAFCALSPMGDLNYSKRLLFGMWNPNAFSWNIVIRATSESKDPHEVFFLYKQMLAFASVSGVNLKPDNYTFPLLFKTCAKLLLFRMGHGILSHVLKLSYDSDIFVHNALIHFLVSCGELVVAYEMFDESPVRDLVTWNSLINGYVKSGRGKEALSIYRKMEAKGDVNPDEVTMIGVVMACSLLEDLKLGREFHQYIRDQGLNMSIPLANSLLDMYVKCGDLERAKELFETMEEKTMVSWTTMVVGYAKFGYFDVARKLFNMMPEKDVVPWNALLSAYVQSQHGKQALSLFQEMQRMGVEPDEVTMVSCLSACAQLGALDVGIWIHRYIKKHNLSINVVLGTALVDMYTKCGNIMKALQVFHEIPGKNALTYTAMIGGLALHGDAGDALSCFLEMIDAGLTPDEITLLGVLSACCHGGLVKEGRKIFSQMSSKFKITPKMKHYSCMVDLLGRAGLLKEAIELIESMPMEADAVVWGAMFFACRMHRNIDLGKRAGMKLLELDPSDSGIYVLLANMYVEENMWDKAGEVRKMMKERGVDKTPGCSSIEVDGNICEFLVRDKSHSQTKQIYACLVQLSKQMMLVECVSHLNNEPLFASEVGS